MAANTEDFNSPENAAARLERDTVAYLRSAPAPVTSFQRDPRQTFGCTGTCGAPAGYACKAGCAG